MALSKNSSIIRSVKPRNPGITAPLKIDAGAHMWVTWLINYAGIFTCGLVSLLSGDIVPPEVDRSILRKPNKDSHEH